MYDLVESWLEACPGLEGSEVVRYLQAWTSEAGGEGARRLHFRALHKRVAAGRGDEVVAWVRSALAAHSGQA
jgi:hypothetical protein